MNGALILKDGTKAEGLSFGYEGSTSGEVVFSTGMVGYPESLTDPSYKGQILIFTYPLIGNYGIPERIYWESSGIQVKGLIVSSYINTPSHHKSVMTLSDWLKKEQIPALEIKDTRLLTQKIRSKGAILGKILFQNNTDWYDPDKENLVSEVSVRKPVRIGRGKIKVAFIDCGTKRSIISELLDRNVEVTIFPWDYDFLQEKKKFNAVIISNGPGNPKRAEETVGIIKKAMVRRVPILGICLGNQLLTLAAGGDTKKLKYGHRSQNQPSLLEGTKRCFLTTQNHGYVVSKIPKGFKPWFTNANDQTNEGIIHEKLPFMSVQFHPEATPGPEDTSWIFDFFLKKVAR